MNLPTFFKSGVLVALALLAGGCSSAKPTAVVAKAASDSATPLRIAFVSNNAEEFWLIAKAGTAKAEKDLGVKVEFRMPARGNAEDQRQRIEDLITSGVRYFAVSVNDAANQVDFYNDIITNKGCTVITQDSDLPAGSKRLCYIGTNNFAAGKSAGDLVKKALPEGGKVAIFVGKLDVQNAVERRNGVIATLAGLSTFDEADALVKKGYPITAGKYTILGTLTDNVKQTQCKANAEDLMTKTPDLGCMVGLWAYNPPQLLLAAKDQNKLGKVKIVGFDENLETLQGVRDGQIVGTIVQQPFEFGYQSIKTLVDVARGDKSTIPAGGIKYVEHKVIDSSNVDAFEKQLNELKGKK
jgi:ribose transport system substrate-binding protein